MKEIVAIVRKEKSLDLKKVLNSENIAYISKNIRGIGKEGKIGYKTKGALISALPKTIFFIWIESQEYKKIIELIINSVHTGNFGDGKIFVLGGEIL